MAKWLKFYLLSKIVLIGILAGSNCFADSVAPAETSRGTRRATYKVNMQGNYVELSSTGQTAGHTFTFPNASGALMTGISIPLNLAGNLIIGSGSAGTGATRTLVLETGTIPSTSPAGATQLYSENVAAPFTATGGTKTLNGGYYYHVFTANDVFAVTGAGNVEVLIIGGGGSSSRGAGGYGGAGGGGAGGYRYSAALAAAGNMNVVVGAGGVGKIGATGYGTNGADSSFGGLTAHGGGTAGTGDDGQHNGIAGASGGGAGAPGTGGAGTGGEGFAGGTSTHQGGCGAGGASAAGANTATPTGTVGGAGIQYAQFSAVSAVAGGWFCGGGGGGNNNANPGNAGGAGGGGASGTNSTSGTAGTPNSGGGAGASGFNVNGVNGGDGVVIIRYLQAGGAELKVRDEIGNITTLSPHNFKLFTPDPSYELPFSYYSRNDYIGKEINVDIYGAIEEIEKLSGKKFIYINDIEQKDMPERQFPAYITDRAAAEKALREDQ